ncbi:unnamed protein product [Sphenostylis stenocarpa]|uniref:tRNA-guanine(15) transglycosylase-like domain-containing protein n=1 Tax=Sphenostylis stenocarpa TaxID=92480 RepID=A0AA86W424_9FABA|nr:unnamed protein product [Sphenostylis stenocarpa]
MQMKFVVKKAWSSGGRVGALEIGSCPGPIETPALLLSTRKGLPHFIAPDLLTSLPSPDSHLLQISPLHFLEGLASTTISKIGGLHQMLGLHQYGIAAVARDSVQCLPESKGATKHGACFETPCGRLLIKPKDYVEMISCMTPNIWASLADEVPAWVSDQRNKTSVDRTVRWLDDCLALNPVNDYVFLFYSSRDMNCVSKFMNSWKFNNRNDCGFNNVLSYFESLGWEDEIELQNK